MLPRAVIVGLDGDGHVGAFAVVDTVKQAARAILEFHKDGLRTLLTSIRRASDMVSSQERCSPEQ